MTSQLQEITAAYTSANARLTPAPLRPGAHERDVDPDVDVMVLPRPEPRRCAGMDCLTLGTHTKRCAKTAEVAR